MMAKPRLRWNSCARPFNFSPLILRCFWTWERPIAKQQTWESSASSAGRQVRPCCTRCTETSTKMSARGRAQLAHYYRALEQDPHWQGAHFGIGEVALHREKLDIAEQEYRHELEAKSRLRRCPGKACRDSYAGGETAHCLYSARQFTPGDIKPQMPWACLVLTRPGAKTSTSTRRSSSAHASLHWRRPRQVLPAAWPLPLPMRAWATTMHILPPGKTSPAMRHATAPECARARTGEFLSSGLRAGRSRSERLA